MGTFFYRKYYMVWDQTPKDEDGKDFIQIGLGQRSAAADDISNQYAPTANQVYPAQPEKKDSSHSIAGYPNVYPDPNPSPNPVPTPTPTPLPTPTPDIKPIIKPVLPDPKPQPNPAPVKPPVNDNTSSAVPVTATGSFFKKNRLVIIIVSTAILLLILTLIICCICYKRHRGPYNTVAYDDGDHTPTNRRSGLINN